MGVWRMKGLKGKFHLESYEIRGIFMLVVSLIMMLGCMVIRGLKHQDNPITMSGVGVLVSYSCIFLIMEVVVFLLNTGVKKIIWKGSNRYCDEDRYIRTISHDIQSIILYFIVLFFGFFAILNGIDEAQAGYNVEIISSFEDLLSTLKFVQFKLSGCLKFFISCFFTTEVIFRSIEKIKEDSKVEGKIFFKFVCYFIAAFVEFMFMLFLSIRYSFLNVWGSWGTIIVVYILICWIISRITDKFEVTLDFTDW